MRRLLNALLLCTALCTATAGAAFAAPAIDAIDLARDGDDLIVFWTPATEPVDGYRVYRFREVACDDPELVFEGPATEYSEVGAFGDPEAALYRIAAYVGGDEGPLTEPAYKYPRQVTRYPTTSSLHLISLPYYRSAADTIELCTDLNNGMLGVFHPIAQVSRFSRERHGFLFHLCAQVDFPTFTVPDGYEAYGLQPSDTTLDPVFVFGHAHPTPQPFDFEGQLERPGSEYRWLHWLSLPYDHDYEDLAELAEDVPNAVFVKLVDPSQTNPLPIGDPVYVGLERSDSSSPWLGDNLTLDDRRGEGVAIGVDVVPTSWAPRRQCGGITRAQRISRLFITESGPDQTDLEWPVEPLATRGYEVFRVDTPRAIPSVLDLEPYRVVGETEPAFPIVDDDARPAATGVIYYQVLAVGDNGFGEL